MFIALPVLAGFGHGNVTPDEASVRALASYGVKSSILRPYSALTLTSDREDGLFKLVFGKAPQCTLLLDRDYWVVVIDASARKEVISTIMLNPVDEQSSLNLTISKGESPQEGFDKSKEPGFGGYTTKAAIICNQPIVWRRCKSSSHLYSDGSVIIRRPDAKDLQIFTVTFNITANSEVRRTALENCMSMITFF